MKTHLNTLFVTLENSYLRKDGAAVEVRHEGQSKLRVPLHNLEGICCFGWDITASAALMHGCHEHGVALSFLSPHGKFLASSSGGVSGNILLRREQYRRGEAEAAALAIARHTVAAKLHNSRTILQRAARDHAPSDTTTLRQAINALEHRTRTALKATSLETLRGIEGDAASSYFSAFNHMITGPKEEFRFNGRTKRPPLDRVNALLSFLYSVLAHDCRSACEAVGLDPQSGFLHQPRPGRPSLALDLMEEFRAFLADRCALTLINRQQICPADFTIQDSGAVLLKEESRKKVLTTWQERKQDSLTHPFLNESVTIGLLPHLQARLLARHLRGDLDAYPAFLAR